MRTLLSKPLVWVVVLAPLTLALGYIGYRAVPGARMSHSDALFGSLQLFAMEGGSPPQGVPLTLNIARFLAPLVVVFATVVALMTILRDQAQRLLVAAFARDHFVIIGLGRSNALLAESLRQSGHTTVVVEADDANPRITAARANGTRVVIGDATQPVMMKRTRTFRARHAVIATGDDSRNLEIADNVRRNAAGEGSKRRLTVHVAMSDQALWAEFGRLQLGRVEEGLTLEFYNVNDRAAQSLLNEAEGHSGRDVFDSVVLVGHGPLAERTLVHLVRRAMLSGFCPEVHVSEEDARELQHLLEREPWIRSRPT